MPPGTHSHFRWGQAYTHLHIWEHPDGGGSGGSTHAQSHRVPWDTPTASWSHGVTQWLRHTGTHSPVAPSLSQRTHRLTSPGTPGMHACPTHMATRPLQPPLESPVRCLTSPPPQPVVQARPWGEAKVELPTETPGGSSQDSGWATDFPGAASLFLASTHPSLPQHPPPHGLRTMPPQPPGARCPPPRGTCLLYLQRVPSP